MSADNYIVVRKFSDGWYYGMGLDGDQCPHLDNKHINTGPFDTSDDAVWYAGVNNPVIEYGIHVDEEPMTQTYDAPDASVSKWWWAKFRGQVYIARLRSTSYVRYQAYDLEGRSCEVLAEPDFPHYSWQPLHLSPPEWPQIDPKPYLVYATRKSCGHETRPEWWKVLDNGRCNIGGIWSWVDELTPVPHPDGTPSDPEGLELIQKAKEKS